MNVSDLKDIADAAQSIAVALAVLAAGIWALFRFWSLGELRKSRVEIEQLKKSLLERGTLNCAIVAEVLPALEDTTDAHYIHVHVTMTNIGNRVEALDWSGGAMHTARVTGHAEGTVTLRDWIETSLVGLHGKRISSSLSPGESKIYPFLVPVRAAGFYYISVVVPGSPEETADARKDHDRVSAAKPGLIRWAAETYVQVTGKQGSPGDA